MQVILGFVLMIIGISYCTESIVSTHKRALRLVKQVERNEYFSFCARIFLYHLFGIPGEDCLSGASYFLPTEYILCFGNLYHWDCTGVVHQ